MALSGFPKREAAGFQPLYHAGASFATKSYVMTLSEKFYAKSLAFLHQIGYNGENAFSR